MKLSGSLNLLGEKNGMITVHTVAAPPEPFGPGSPAVMVIRFQTNDINYDLIMDETFYLQFVNFLAKQKVEHTKQLDVELPPPAPGELGN